MNNNTREFTKSEVDKLFDADLLWLEDENGESSYFSNRKYIKYHTQRKRKII